MFINEESKEAYETDPKLFIQMIEDGTGGFTQEFISLYDKTDEPDEK